MVTPEIGLTENQRAGSAHVLNKLLANEYILYTKTLNYHWNVKGPHFGILHTFFEKQYAQLFEIIDATAERVTALGHRAWATAHEFARETSLKEISDRSPIDKDMIQDLLTDHEAIIRLIRTDAQRVMEEYNDLGSNNFLSDLIEKHEKMAWMLRAHLEK